MLIKKGQLLNVNHRRKGKFIGMAIEDFDTETREFFPIAVAQPKHVLGMSQATTWREGEEIPCRKTLCSISLRVS